jgi:hypothetical protein
MTLNDHPKDCDGRGDSRPMPAGVRKALDEARALDDHLLWQEGEDEAARWQAEFFARADACDDVE